MITFPICRPVGPVLGVVGHSMFDEAVRLSALKIVNIVGVRHLPDELDGHILKFSPKKLRVMIYLT